MKTKTFLVSALTAALLGLSAAASAGTNTFRIPFLGLHASASSSASGDGTDAATTCTAGSAYLSPATVTSVTIPQGCTAASFWLQANGSPASYALNASCVPTMTAPATQGDIVTGTLLVLSPGATVSIVASLTINSAPEAWDSNCTYAQNTDDTLASWYSGGSASLKFNGRIVATAAGGAGPAGNGPESEFDYSPTYLSTLVVAGSVSHPAVSAGVDHSWAGAYINWR